MTHYKYFFTKCFRTVSITTEDKNIILKAYSTQKVGSGGNFESGNQGYAADRPIKLTDQKDANHILTRKCFTIAIKTIQLSSHIKKLNMMNSERSTFPANNFFETNNIFAIRGKNAFYFITCVKRRNSVVSNMRNITTN